MLSAEDRLDLYRMMWTIRAFEEEAAGQQRSGAIAGNIHLSVGQEAIATGVCAALRVDDQIATTHRGHGHCIAKGGQLERMFAELYGHLDGYCKGRAGSMHIADPAVGILGATAIVGGSLGIAVGAAFSAQTRGSDGVAVAFFGEGAAAQGSLHEALNLAALWKLPMIFCCENNQYAELTHVREHISGRIYEFAQAHQMPGHLVDGNDVLAVSAATEAAVARAREAGGPTLLECETYRLSGHYSGDPEQYRAAAEVEDARAADPIARFGELLAAEAGAERVSAVEAEERAAVTAAAERAAAGVVTPAGLLLEDVYAS